MKRSVTILCVVIGLLTVTSAFALDLSRHSANPLPLNKPIPNTTTAVLGCDDNYAYNAYYQGTDDRLGNIFDFGAGSLLSRVGFVHYGWGFPGPYNYDVEIWDPTSCTYAAGRNNLVASDAASNLVYEEVDLCPNEIFLTGYMVVTIDPNTCLASDDCYPDLMFDDQLNVFCPVIINNASTAPACYDVSSYNGPFLLRVETDNCPTPVQHRSWGALKSIYR
jgi:hypothetical protein